MDPIADIFVGEDDGAGLGENAVPGDVVNVVVRVDDVFDRQRRELADFGEQRAVVDALNVDHKDAILANHKSGSRRPRRRPARQSRNRRCGRAV